SRKQLLQPRVFDLAALVKGLGSLITRVIGEDVQLLLDVDHAVGNIKADPGQIEQVIINLAVNARDAMPTGGTLRIGACRAQFMTPVELGGFHIDPGLYARISVTDTGIGMVPKIMAHIFEPFFTTKEPGKGTGLGLSMVFGFVKQSGGHINVYSEPGVGTTFRLYLPRDPAGRAAAAASEPAAATAGGDETVLVVEDNEAVRRIVMRQLASLGYRVAAAGSAAEALEVLARERITLLFSDIVMPGGMSGIELAEAARARWPGLRVLLTSGFPEARLRGTGYPADGVRLLSKPYGREQLARTLREVLDRPA